MMISTLLSRSSDTSSRDACSEAELSSTLPSMSEPSINCSTFDDNNTMTGAASVPISTSTCGSSINTEGSPTSVMRFDHMNSSLTSTEASQIVRNQRKNSERELKRITELERKRSQLRFQRFSLEQRLYEFCGKHSESGTPESTESFQRVIDLQFRDKSSGVRVLYSGPVNAFEEPHGKDGIMKFSDGQVYRGEVQNGYRWGTGQNSWPDGQYYNGEWKENSRNGRGTHQWPDGRKVTGEWTEGHLNGKAYFSWPNGATYEGMCKMGKKHGRGVHTWSDGKTYNGHFEKGKEHGFGTLSFPDGVKYRGQFKAGSKHGYGIMLWKTRTYDGEWVSNKPCGQGRVVWSNGALYTGQFRDGKYHGLGVYKWPSGKKFVGRWENGVKNGHGLYTWPNGKKYDGEYLNGMKHGYGRMTWPDGQTYCGAFEYNKRTGRGVLTGPDGKVLHCGMWNDDTALDDDHNPMPEVMNSPPNGIPENVTIKPTSCESTLDDSPVSDKYPHIDESRETSFPPALIEPQHDICSPKMIALDDDDDELLELGVQYEKDDGASSISLSRLQV